MKKKREEKGYQPVTITCTQQKNVLFWQVMILEANRHKLSKFYINTYVKDQIYLAGGRVLCRRRPPSASASAGAGASIRV